ncbi:hypothetical protein PISMIDRAFT_17957 [Pisolithus microcarpus 441]|uniref:Uncharacterized protein n=1 Tax=Pisolithus microcarpus 441 TaxID=765257 RepID=A0A0C9Y9D0_9AGAM|nr:hypothetical protein BKA83DRAFT_17957 [Pisolithus microcarpus]KIK13491.1 hypothetical protein PISMIDRAFT_17957 [Pisolithus microcarpus 441]
MPTPTNLTFAPAPTITMVDNIVLIDVDGFSSDWDAYTFSLNISSPGTKVENVTFENKEPVKSEEITVMLPSQSVPTVSKLEEPGESHSIKLEDLADCENGMQTASLTLFPCTLLTRITGNMQARDDMPSKPWKYYLCSFDPSILPIEIERRKEAMEKYEDRLEREEKRRRLV